MKLQMDSKIKSASHKKAGSFTIVAIGASAGGLEAITELLQNVSSNTGMAFIYVQHLSPDHKSLLTSLLSKKTDMQVQEIEDMEKMKPNNVYIIPFNKEIEVTDGHIKLIPRPKNKPTNLSVDVLFSSLAETHRENVIGIILSGNGRDGSRGLKEIKIAGGVTFAQDDSAKSTGMPHSAIAEGIVDYVLSPKEIAQEINSISKHVFRKGSSLKEVSEDTIQNDNIDLKKILQILLNTKEVDFSHYKMNTIKRRVLRRMLLHKIKTIKSYAKFVQEDNNEPELLYNDLLINVSDFFRDAPAFVLLKKAVLPKILKGKSSGEALRIWVAACATGEEVYSIAMSIIELQENKSNKVPFQIFASDLSAKALKEARRGEYTLDQIKNVSKKRLQQFFTRVKDKYRVSQHLRDVCIFAQHNILSDPPFSHMDFISCRNVLIYLENDAQKKAISTFHYALNEGGYLMLGKSETIGTSTPLFSPINKLYKIYARKKHREVTRIPNLMPRVLLPSFRNKVMPNPTSTKNIIPPSNISLSNTFDSILLAKYVPASVVITHAMEILQFRGQTSLYLIHPSGKASFNILKMAIPEISFELRNAIHQAIKSKQTVVKEGIEIRRDEIKNVLQIVNIEISHLSDNAEEPLLAVVFTGQKAILTEPFIKGKNNNSIAKDRRISKLEEEIVSTRHELISITHEHETINEELQSANEEAISSNEELQSLNEELETSKEEIESTNEELTTTNQELQARILENQMLLETLSSTSDNLPGVIYKFKKKVDGTYSFPYMSNMCEQLLGLKQEGLRDGASAFFNSVHKDDIKESLERISHSANHLTDWECEFRIIKNNEIRWIKGHSKPKLNADRSVVWSGYLFDVTEEKKLHSEFERLAMVAKRTSNIVVITDLEKKIIWINEAFTILTGYTLEEVQGRTPKFLQFEETNQDTIKYVNKKLDSHQSARFEILNKGKKGNTYWLDIEIQPVIDRGKVVGFAAIETDITDKKREDDEKGKITKDLIQHNKNLEQFSYIVSHNLRAPVANILGFSELLKNENSNPRLLLDIVKDMAVAAKNMDIVIRDLNEILNMSKVVSENKIEVHFQDLIEEISISIDNIIKKENVIIRSDFKSVDNILSIRSYLYSIFYNLILNSIKFQKPGVSPLIEIRSIRTSNGLQLIFKDNGMGIDLEKHQHNLFGLYKRFHLQVEGKGMGLFMLKTQVETLGGKISVSSEVNKGSEFTIEFENIYS